MMRLFLYESKKAFGIRQLLLILLVMGIQVWLGRFPYDTSERYSPAVYKAYTTELQGAYTTEKQVALQDKYDAMLEVIAAHDATKTAYLNNEITLEEFDAQQGILCCNGRA